MVKRFKDLAAGVGSDGHLAKAVKESAQQIWLAGLGAFAKAQEEGQKVFNVLVKEGTSIQKRTMKMSEEKIDEVTSKVAQVAGDVQKQASGTWDKLETVFEQRVERAMARLGVPTQKEVSTLKKRVDELTVQVKRLGGTRAKAAKKSEGKSAST